jgi:hypothetical protein
MAFVEHLRLISVAGHPGYVFSLAGYPVLSVSAESGQTLPPVSAATAVVVAEQFTGENISGIDGPFDYDQWTVHEQYGPYRPFYKVTLDDAAGTCIYISLRSGEVIQRTRRTERAWNWIGAVVHWINPTLLRKQGIAENDPYRVLSNPLPDTARRILIDDPAHTWLQVGRRFRADCLHRRLEPTFLQMAG